MLTPEQIAERRLKMQERIVDAELQGARGVANDVMASGIPQEVVRGSFNLMSSLAQAGATNPLAGSAMAIILSDAMNRMGIIGTPAARMVQGGAVGYLGGSVVGDVVSDASEWFPFSGNTVTQQQVQFDIPDTPVPSGRIGRKFGDVSFGGADLNIPIIPPYVTKPPVTPAPPINIGPTGGPGLPILLPAAGGGQVLIESEAGLAQAKDLGLLTEKTGGATSGAGSTAATIGGGASVLALTPGLSLIRGAQELVPKKPERGVEYG